MANGKTFLNLPLRRKFRSNHFTVKTIRLLALSPRKSMSGRRNIPRRMYHCAAGSSDVRRWLLWLLSTRLIQIVVDRITLTLDCLVGLLLQLLRGRRQRLGKYGRRQDTEKAYPAGKNKNRKFSHEPRTDNARRGSSKIETNSRPVRYLGGSLRLAQRECIGRRSYFKTCGR